jgi:transposase
MIAKVGTVPDVPANPTHPAVRDSRPAYRRRNRVERLWGRSKEWQAVATRYKKTGESYFGALYVAPALGVIRRSPT